MIICCGEALVDLVQQPGESIPTARPGGAPANTAVAAARLGAPSAFSGRISTDAHGEMLLAHLRASGVRLDLVERGPEPTAVARVEYDPTPVFHFEGENTADTVLGPIDPDVLGLAAGQPLLIHSGSLAMFRGSAAASILDCFERLDGAALRCLDPNVRPFAITDVGAWRARLDRWLAASDLLRSSEEDLRWIDPSQAPLETAAQLLEAGPAVAVVTRGAAGAAVLSSAGTVEVSATPADVTDTVGAGDSFTGALLTWLHRRDVGGRSSVLALSAEDWREALQFSSKVAAVTCSRVGADPPWASELEDR